MLNTLTELYINYRSRCTAPVLTCRKRHIDWLMASVSTINDRINYHTEHILIGRVHSNIVEYPTENYP